MATLPSGTVTFLFTDIEGSTRRWEQHRAEMEHALAQHDAVLRVAIEGEGGSVFKTVGDAFCAAFPTAIAALQAALAAQRAILAESWPNGCTIRVRMALHTGAAEERDGDYFGPTLNRVARILAAGHGGQILLSLVTAELVRDQLPASSSLLDLSDHRLKDLTRPERIFQLSAPPLPADFPPLKTLDARPNNLPLQRSPLLGRERELDAVMRLVGRPEVGLVTLTGAGGTGKTRLALQVAADLLDQFPDGVWFVDLAPIRDPHLIPGTIAQALAVREEPNASMMDSLRSYLRKQQLLLVLDNFEQVVEGATLVSDLLRAASDVKVLVTSRVPLHLHGEHEFPVPPFAVPDLRQRPTPRALTQYAAVALFIERAQAVKPDFEVTNASAPAVAEICVRLDGLPLAIELAAARVKLFPPTALLQRLGDRLKLLTGGARDLPARQQTLRSTIDWSYDLLSPHEQRLFARLGVFTGGWSLEAAEAVCGGDGTQEMDVLDGLQLLVDKSLVQQVEQAGDREAAELRFRMLETIREFALERLNKHDDVSVIHSRHAAYYLSLLDFLTNGNPGIGLNPFFFRRMEVEQDNARAAMTWALEHGDNQSSLGLARTMGKFWMESGYAREARQWLDKALGASRPGAEPLPAAEARSRARALAQRYWLAWRLGDYTGGKAYATEALALYRELGDRRGIAYEHLKLAGIAGEMGDVAAAQQQFQDALVLVAGVEDPVERQPMLNDLGFALYLAGDQSRALPVLEEAVALSRKPPYVDTYSLCSLAVVVLEHGDYARARMLLDEGIRIAYRAATRDVLPWYLEAFAWLATPAAPPGETHIGARRAARLFGAAEAANEAIEGQFSRLEQAAHLRHVALARGQIDEATWTAAWHEGRGMTLDQAFAYAVDAPSCV